MDDPWDLVMRQDHTIRAIANHLWHSHWRACDAGGLTPDDLYQLGFIAAYDAAQKFDPARGVEFGAMVNYYLHTRLRDAIYPNRYRDEHPGGGRRSFRHAVPDRISVEQLREVGFDVTDKHVDVEAEVLGHLTVDEAWPDVWMQLSDREKLIMDCIVTYGVGGGAITAAAEALGVTVSRVSQMVTRIRRKFLAAVA